MEKKKIKPNLKASRDSVERSKPNRKRLIGTKVLVTLDAKIARLLEKFQGSYQAEFGKRITKEQVINLALEVYIKKCYELSTEKE